MQALLECNDLMADNLTEILRDRLTKFEKKTDESFSGLGERIHGIDEALTEIRVRLEPQRKPWWLTTIVAPLIVAAILAAAGDMIYLHICIKGLQGYVQNNGGFIAELQLQKSASQPTIYSAAAQVKQVLKSAKKQKVDIDPKAIEDAGKKFINASSTSPDAWETAISLVDYRSYLNKVPAFPSDVTKGLGRSSYTTEGHILNPDFQALSAGLSYSSDKRAQFRSINSPDLNAGHTVGNSFLLFNNAVLLLDDLYARNVIIENSRVIYRGGTCCSIQRNVRKLHV